MTVWLAIVREVGGRERRSEESFESGGGEWIEGREWCPLSRDFRGVAVVRAFDSGVGVVSNGK